MEMHLSVATILPLEICTMKIFTKYMEMVVTVYLEDWGLALR